MVKLYTKAGDKGKTSLYDFREISKADFTFEVLGDLDELSATLGIVCANLDRSSASYSEARGIQSILLHIGSHVATLKRRGNLRKINSADVEALEKSIDFYTEATPELKEFILPGAGTILDSHYHLARAVCRRAERHLVRLSEEVRYLDEEPHLFEYMNRLSDYLFAAARYWGGKGVEEVWKKDK